MGNSVSNLRRRIASELRLNFKVRNVALRQVSEKFGLPIFVVGSGRSGNTLIRRGLVEHGEVCIPPETYVLGKVIRSQIKSNTIEWGDCVDNVLGAFSSHPEYVDTFGYSLDGLKCRMKHLSENEQSLARLVSEFYLYYGEMNGKMFTRWGDKTPLNTLSIDGIHAVFRDALFVWVIRDPVDVAASYLRSGIYNSLEKSVDRWVRSNTIMVKFAKRHSDKVIMVSYEALVRDFKTAIKAICEFADLQYAEAEATTRLALGDVEKRTHHSNVLGPVTSSSVGKGRRELRQADISYIENRTSSILRKAKFSNTWGSLLR